jgi:arsenate reductase-like glutaredoxin family protein
MKDIVKNYWDLRDKAKRHGDEIAVLFHIQPHELPANVFAMAFNDITITLELLDHYYKTWGDPTTKISTTREEAIKQNAERVVAIQKMVFIGIMSSVEFCGKQLAYQTPYLGVFKGRIYLRMIMERSKAKKIISDSDFNLWEGIINFRNTMVHNNGIAEIDMVYRYPKCELKMSIGKMTQGKLTLFPNLTDWVLDAAKDWFTTLKP